MMKYCCGFALVIVCIITPRILHPSSAGIGSILKNANAKDIIAANAKNHFRPATCLISLPILMAPTGPDNLLIPSFTSCALKDNNCFPNEVKPYRVSLPCSMISYPACLSA